MGLMVPTGYARAELLLSQLIVELAPDTRSRTDLEIVNTGPDRAFVTVEPREILNAGTEHEAHRQEADPEKLGLLVTPNRVVLEAGQRKLVRIAAISAGERERVYRVTVKPVLGKLTSSESGLKVLVGYDALVLVRPSKLAPHVSSQWSAGQLIVLNDGNVSVELVDGERCSMASKSCEPVPGGRLYVGAKKKIAVRPGGQVKYKLKVSNLLVPVVL